MQSLDEIINESRDSREVKRALSVKMILGQMPTVQVCALLNVSPQYVSKWRLEYESSGAASLLLGYVGSQSYLTPGYDNDSFILQPQGILVPRNSF